MVLKKTAKRSNIAYDDCMDSEGETTEMTGVENTLRWFMQNA